MPDNRFLRVSYAITPLGAALGAAQTAIESWGEKLLKAKEQQAEALPIMQLCAS